ncbi:unnamed protein product [Adineta ricciae]|uniref:Uncharacterized protein n=1 Tax=Adineta ricciae TaxID=249248 RepID=A0A814T9C5_ADIRI|nr:unnamed protein product [Adineta ricciae]CAF1337092.1 unnamed protein product [Adineta ricciae]
MSNLPPWLIESRENVLKTKEWDALTHNIYDAVDQHLAQSHVQYFTDLSDAEKSLVLERAARSLRATTNGGPTPYDNLNKRVSDCLDKGVNNDVSRSLIKDDPTETKSDLILDKVCDGIVGLLRKWPDQKYKLHAFLNQPLPQPIRFVGWHLYLNNPTYRQRFTNDLTNNSRSVLSPLDADIQRNCDSLVPTLPSANDMVDSKGNMSAMKAILSYHHSMLSNNRDLSDSEYYYAVPIVLSHNPPLSRTEKPYEKSLGVLIEMYRTFLDTMPPTLRDVYLNNSTQELDPWFVKVEYYLKEIDRPLYNHIRSTVNSSDAHTSASVDQYVLSFIRKCCYPWFKYMFVGCLSADPLMYVWDQYLITSDVPKFHDELIPAIAAAMIVTLRDFLLKCRSPSDMEAVLQRRTNIIITRQLQSVVVRFFLTDFKNRIAKSHFGPVIDPTEGRQWTGFNRDHVPQVANRPEQRFNDRERNEQTLQLEKRLREEMAKREENERLLQSKIEQLQRDMERMRQNPVMITTAQPVITTIPPRAQTPVERYVVTETRPKPVTPPPALKDTSHRAPLNSPVHDLLRRIAQTCNRVAHGEGRNSQVLNEQTKNDIRVHKLDLKMAERQVIGRTLQVDEWEHLPATQKEVYSQQMLEAVKARIQKRYTAGRKG